MRELRIDISHHRSKGVDEFAEQPFDYILTVCDNAKETCPIFPGHGMHIHHSFDDPGAVQGTDEERLAAFRRAATNCRHTLSDFLKSNAR
jgi:arsenate reductase